MNHEDIGVLLLAIGSVSIIISLILCVLFGQITVRRLRKHPETRNRLGFEWMSGWDIFNVAKAVSLPRRYCRRVENGPLYWLHADSDAIYRNTTARERALGRAQFWTNMFGAFWIFALAAFTYLT